MIDVEVAKSSKNHGRSIAARSLFNHRLSCSQQAFTSHLATPRATLLIPLLSLLYSIPREVRSLFPSKTNNVYIIPSKRDDASKFPTVSVE
jgi:hypothetical protein